MTEITETRKGDRVRVSMHGHALVNPGNDPVCAAISCLAYTMIGWLDKKEDDGKIKDLVIDIDDGHVVVSFTDSKKVWAGGWEVLSMGFEQLADSYPENVYFRERT